MRGPRRIVLLVALVVGANACSLALDRQRPSGDGGDASRDGDIVDAPRDAPADRSVDGPPGDGLPDADLASDRGLDLDGPDAQPPDLGPCGGGCAAGLECVSGACVCTTNSCGGCCEGNTCVALGAQTPARCGRNGQTCAACTAPSNPCRQASCTAAGTCGDVPAPSGTACPTGRCANGTCCSGCINNNICQPGTVMQACGTGGAACTSCITFDPCRPASCVSGSCTSTNLPDNTPCTEGSSSGRCVSGACCHGCRRANGACNATASILNCGSGGQACVDCTASEPECKQSQCIAGGCNYVNKGNGTPCSTGTCQGGVCQ